MTSVSRFERITGTGSYLPPRRITNHDLVADLAQRGVQTSDEWIVERTGIHAEPVLFSGSLDIIERALSQRCMPGAKVIIESPCWLPLLALLANLRLEAVPAVMDEEGALIPPGIDFNDISAVILTARAHSPTGICYSPERWQAWQQALSCHNPLLIIDDHWGALSRHPFQGMQGFANEWIYTTSTSKFLGTDMRLAIAAGHGPTLAAMKKRFTLGPRWISKLLQHLTLKLWQALGAQGLAAIAESYQTRRQYLITCLAERGIRVPGRHGEGMHIWLNVPNEAQLIQFLAAKGWAVQSGTPFNPGKQPAVRITISNLSLEDCQTLADDIAATLAAGGETIY